MKHLYRLIILCLSFSTFFLFSAFPALASGIARDNNSGATQLTTGQNYTVNTSGSCIIVVTDGAGGTSAMTYNSVSMSTFGSVVGSAGDIQTLWQLPNVSAGTHALAWTGGGGALVSSYTNTNTTNCVGNVTQADNAGQTVSVTAQFASSWLVLSFTNHLANNSIASGPVTFLNGSANGWGTGDSNGAVSAGSQTVTMSINNGKELFALFEILAAPSAAKFVMWQFTDF